MDDDQTKRGRSEAEAQSEAERLVEFCSVWTEGCDDPSGVRSATLAYLALQLTGKNEAGK